MPRLPDVTSLGARPTPRPSRPLASISQGAVMAPGQAAADLGETLFREGERRADKAADFELATARSNFLRQSLALERELEENPDAYASWGSTYQKRIGQLRGELAAGLRDIRAREAFMEQSETAVIRGQDRILGLARRQEVDRGRAALDDLVSSDLDAALSVSDRETRDAILANVSDAIEGARGKGYLTAQEAVSLRRSTVETFAARRLSMLPPAERLSAIGAAPAGRLSSEVAGIVDAAAAGTGINADDFRRMVMLESAGDPGAINPTSGAAGLVQLMPATAAEYGVANPLDAVEAARGGAELWRDNSRRLAVSLGREPAGWEVYLAHQQGAGGASVLLGDPRGNVVDVLSRAYGGDRERARQAVAQNGGRASMSAGDFANLWRAKFEAAGSAVTASAGPEASLAAFLPPDEIEKVKQDALDALEVEQAKAEREYVSSFETYVSAVRSGAQVAPEMAARFSDPVINALIEDPERRSLLRAERDDAVLQSAILRDLQGATPDEIEAMAQRLGSMAEGEVFSETGLAMAPSRAQAAQAFSQALAADLKARAEDPAKYALRTPTIRRAAEAEGGEQDYASATLAEQERIGIPRHARRVLSNDAAKETVAALMRTDADMRGAEITRLEQQWGEHWPTVLRQLGENDLNPALYHAALVVDDPVISERVAALADVSPKDLADGLDSLEVKDIRDGITSEMAEFRQAFEAGDPTGAASRRMAELHEIAVGVALQEYRRTGDASGAVDFAASRLVNDRYQILDGSSFSAYVPAEFDAGAVEAGAERLLEDEALERIAPLGGDEDDPEFLRNARIRRAAEDGVFVTNATGDGLVLMVELDGRLQMLRDRDGQPYGISFADAVKQDDRGFLGRLSPW